MNDMIKAERQKILSRTSIKILFIAGIFITLVYFFFFQFFYQTVYYDYESEKMDTVSGFQSIQQRKEIAALFEGDLTQDTLKKIEAKLAAAKTETINKDENSKFSAIYVYRDQAAILEYLINSDGTMKSIEEGYTNSKPIILGYCDGWDNLLSSMGSILSIIMCLIIIIGISPVFAEEYAYHTDSVLCAARYGKSKLIIAKIIASLQSVIVMYAIYVWTYIILYGVFYGLEGYNVSIQASMHYSASTYEMNFIQMFLSTVALNILGIIALTLITLFFSSKMNSSASALIISCIICFLPVIFDFSESIPLLQKIQEICPIFMMHVNGVFAKMQKYAGIIQPIIMIGFNTVLTAVFYEFTKHTFEKHQVTG